MKSSGLRIEKDVCGLELFVLDDHVEICGKPGVLWGLMDLSGWEDEQIVACEEHTNVLFDNPHVYVTSDEPIAFGECTCGLAD